MYRSILVPLDGSATVAPPDDYVVTMSWKALEPSTILDAFIGIDLAQNLDQFASAVEFWDIAPQNLVYADVEGNIGYFPTGELPLRAAGDGRYPAPGWAGEYDWVGIVAEEDKPRPILWAYHKGQGEQANGGRVFVSIMGHYTWTFDDPLFRLLVLRGICWTAREEADRLSDLAVIGARMTP